MEVRCPICQEQYDSEYRIPRIVPQCGHTFCQVCIQQSNKRFFVCPLDNQTHHFENEKIDMPRNLTILRVIKNKTSSKVSFSPVITTKQNVPIQYYSKLHNPKNDYDNTKLSSQILSLNQQIVNKSKVVQQSLQDINRYLISKINDKFKIYYQSIKKHEQFFISEVNKLNQHYQSIFSVLSTQMNSHILQSYDVLNSNDSQKIKYLSKQIQNTSNMLITKVTNIKQSVNKHFDLQQLLKINVSSTFMTHLTSQDIQLKNNRTNSVNTNINSNISNINNSILNKSQVSIHTPTKISQNCNLSIYSKLHSTQRNRQNKDLVSQFKLFVQRKHKRDYSQATSNTKFSPNLRKPMKLINQANRQSNIFQAHQYYDFANAQPSPRKRSVNSSRSNFIERGQLQNRRKLDNILQTIRETRSPNLQFINMEIKDSFLKQIGECIVKSGSKIGLLKLVKNQITDRGLEFLLEQLSDYQYMHTLNLTSNYLSDTSLDIILEFSKTNTILTNFYVSNNNFSVPKGYRKLLNQSGINVFF